MHCLTHVPGFRKTVVCLVADYAWLRPMAIPIPIAYPRSAGGYKLLFLDNMDHRCYLLGSQTPRSGGDIVALTTPAVASGIKNESEGTALGVAL